MRTYEPLCRLLPRVLTVAALGVVLGACVSVQVPKLPTGVLPAHWHNAPKLGEKPDLTGWWKHFHDPELNTLVARAVKDNPDIVQAVWKLRAARALEEASATQFKPQVAFNTLEQSNAANTASFFQLGFDASWEIGLFGRQGAHGYINAAKTGAAEADLQSARVSLVAEVVREFLRLRAAQSSEALLQKAAHAAENKVRLLRVRRHLQLSSQREVEQALIAAANAKAKLVDPHMTITSSAYALALLLGKSEPDPAWFEPAPLPHLENANVVSLPANLLRTRPGIHYAETQVLKAAGELGIAKANLYPRLSLGGGLTFASRILGHDHLGTANEIAGIGPMIHIPLFDWGQLKSVHNARADLLQAALAGYREAVLKGATQVETDLASLNAARQRLKYADAAAAAAQHSVGLSEKLQSLGEADQMNLADAQLALSQSQLGRVQARLQHALAFVALYKALGGAPLPKNDAASGIANTNARATAQGPGS